MSLVVAVCSLLYVVGWLLVVAVCSLIVCLCFAVCRLPYALFIGSCRDLRAAVSW